MYELKLHCLELQKAAAVLVLPYSLSDLEVVAHEPDPHLLELLLGVTLQPAADLKSRTKTAVAG